MIGHSYRGQGRASTDACQGSLQLLGRLLLRPRLQHQVNYSPVAFFRRQARKQIVADDVSSYSVTALEKPRPC